MSAASRLASFKTLLAHARERTGIDIGFVLWDASTVPADLAPSALAIHLADEGVIGALVRRPNLDTLLNLWVAKRIDIRNGTFFDLPGIRTRLRSRELRGAINK